MNRTGRTYSFSPNFRLCRQLPTTDQVNQTVLGLTNNSAPAMTPVIRQSTPKPPVSGAGQLPANETCSERRPVFLTVPTLVRVLGLATDRP
jgi:hypothetical protein